MGCGNRYTVFFYGFLYFYFFYWFFYFLLFFVFYELFSKIRLAELAPQSRCAAVVRGPAHGAHVAVQLTQLFLDRPAIQGQDLVVRALNGATQKIDVAHAGFIGRVALVVPARQRPGRAVSGLRVPELLVHHWPPVFDVQAIIVLFRRGTAVLVLREVDFANLGIDAVVVPDDPHGFCSERLAV